MRLADEEQLRRVERRGAVGHECDRLQAEIRFGGEGQRRRGEHRALAQVHHGLPVAAERHGLRSAVEPGADLPQGDVDHGATLPCGDTEPVGALHGIGRRIIHSGITRRVIEVAAVEREQVHVRASAIGIHFRAAACVVQLLRCVHAANFWGRLALRF